MVVFTCNACNESLKKNQVEKHYQQKCRRCEFLSCVDCGKEFWGDSYQSHIKCISEEEKYSGKNYVAKPNKGEVKQEQWIQKVQSAIKKAPANPQLRNLLQRLEEYPNVPRKKTKFENFLKCSLRVFNVGLMNQVWDLLMAESQQQNGNKVNTANAEDQAAATVASTQVPSEAGLADNPTTDNKDSERKLSKRERKEDRKKKMHKAEKKDKHGMDNGVAEEEEESKRKKKGKKRKRDDEEEVENEVEVQIKQKKKKKVEKQATEDHCTAAENVEIDQDILEPTGKKGRFDWNATIIAVLQSKGEIPVKRLQKKVLNEYASYGTEKAEEKVVAKFNKKLSKLPNVKVLKDRAKLIKS